MGRSTLLNAAIGAVVTVLFSFTGFSAILGGGVAGYLQRETRRDGAKVGALAGVLATVPFLVLAVFFFGFVAGPMMGGGFGFHSGPEILVIVFLVPLFFLWNGVLGAIGGYLGTYVSEEFETAESDRTDPVDDE